MIDSSGLAVHAGQLRRAPKSRDYRKLHLCVDEQTGEVVAGELTSKRARDSSRVASVLSKNTNELKTGAPGRFGSETSEAWLANGS